MVEDPPLAAAIILAGACVILAAEFLHVDQDGDGDDRAQL